MKKDRFEMKLDRLAKAIEKIGDRKLDLQFTKFLNELKPLLQEYRNLCAVFSMFPTMPETTGDIVNVKVKPSG